MRCILFIVCSSLKEKTFPTMSSDDFALLDDSDLRLPEDAVDERFAELFEKQNATVRTINEDLEAVVIRQLDEYFAQLEGRTPHPLYDLVVHAVERPLIEYAMSMCHRNQCAAAQLLGINRNTLRKKLLEHGMLQARGRSKQKEK